MIATRHGLLIATVMAAALLAGCGSGGGSGNSEANVALLEATPREKLTPTATASCDALKSYVSESIAESMLRTGWGGCPSCIVPMLEGAPLAADGAGADRFTGTNNQEAGVDELDRVEAGQDGFFYLLDGRHLVIARASPATELREVGHLELTRTGYPTGLILDETNNRLVVAVADHSKARPSPVAAIAPDHGYEPVVELLFIDVLDRTQPVVDRRFAIEGYSMTVRRIGQRVHLASHFTPLTPQAIFADEPLRRLQETYFSLTERDSNRGRELEAEIRTRVAALIVPIDAGEFLPERRIARGDGLYEAIPDPTCDDVATPDVSMGYALTSITSVDTDGREAHTLSLTNNAWQVYASHNQFYLLQDSGGWQWNENQRQQTAIYSIAVGEGAPAYRALGLVDGWANSSFQLSEDKGYLRIATSRDEYDPESDTRLQDNHLFVLKDDTAGALAEVGAINGYAPGERIFSARFLGDRGFVVTFRQIDPLFAFDLSNPRDPRLLGDVEIPGVSTYIHPLDEKHLLTIGLNGDDTGLDWQMRLQIFDVQDLTKPRLLHAYVPEFGGGEGAWSAAVNDHLAFNYFPEARTLTIPVQLWGRRHDESFSGFASYAVSTQDGFSELGLMNHADLAHATYCPETASGSASVACDEGYYLEAATPARAIGAVIDGEQYIFTISDVGVKAARGDALSDAIAVLPLSYPNHYWWWF